MRVSVVIPAYNVEATVADAVLSAAAQTLAPVEIIVVDDGSTDGTMARVPPTGGIPLVQLRTEQEGVSVARNAGIQVARGDFIALLDADDVWDPDHLAAAAGSVGAGDVAWLCARDVMREDGTGRRRALSWPEPRGGGLPARRCFQLWCRHAEIGTSCFVLRRDRLVEVGGFDPAFRRGEDVECLFRVIAGGTWAYDPKPTLAYRLARAGGLCEDKLALAHDGLRALLSNRARYPHPEMERQIQLFARHVVSLAYTDGCPPSFWPRILEAERHLGRWDALVFRAAARAPWAFRGLNRLRRKVLRPDRRAPDDGSWLGQTR